MNALDSNEPSNVATLECFYNKVRYVYINSEFTIINFTKLLYAFLTIFILK